MKLLLTGLAALALVVGCSSTQEQATSTVLKRSLLVLAAAQEDYFANNGTYTTEIELLDHGAPERVTTTILYASEDGWIGVAQEEDIVCARYEGWGDGEFPPEVQPIIKDYGLAPGILGCKYGGDRKRVVNRSS